MDHLKALGIKFIYTSIIIFSLFGIFNNVSIGKLFIMSLMTTGISYIVGDLIVLPRIGNIRSTILDFGLSFLTVLILGGLFIITDIKITLASLAAAFFMMCIEPLFHTYMVERVFNPDKDLVKDHNHQIKTTQLHPKLLTEFAEETDTETITRNNSKDKSNTDDDSPK